MFIKLAELLGKSDKVVLTVTSSPSGQLLVTTSAVCAGTDAKSDKLKEALNSPMVVQAPPEELDVGFGFHLADYVNNFEVKGQLPAVSNQSAASNAETPSNDVVSTTPAQSDSSLADFEEL